MIYVLPVAQRPAGYNPLGIKNLDPGWIRRLGQSGCDCYDAIVGKDLRGLGASMNESMRCWEAILPGTVRHPALTVDLLGLLDTYQSRYAGAMYSGCGGGYLYVVSEEAVPGGFQIKVQDHMKTVVVSGSFDDLRSHHIRLLQEAARLGAVHALLWSDERVMAAHGRAPTFPLAERHYVLQAIRYVTQVTVINPPYDADALPPVPDRRVDAYVGHAGGRGHTRPARLLRSAGHRLPRFHRGRPGRLSRRCDHQARTISALTRFALTSGLSAIRHPPQALRRRHRLLRLVPLGSHPFLRRSIRAR